MYTQADCPINAFIASILAVIILKILMLSMVLALLVVTVGTGQMAHAQSTPDLTLAHNFGTHHFDLAPHVTPVPGFAFPNEHFVDRHVVSDDSILTAQVQHSLVPGGDSLLILTSIPGAHGTVDVTAFYTAGSGTTSHTITVLVGPPPTPPIAENFTVTIHHDNPSPVRIVDHISDVNVPTQTLTVEILDHHPITNLLIVSGGSVTDGRYILSSDNIVNVRHHSASPNNQQTATFSYNVTNDVGSSIGMVRVEIPAAPTPPVANSFLADIHHSNPSHVNIRAMTNDGNQPSQPLTVVIDSVRDVEIVDGLVEPVTYPATSGMLAPGRDPVVQSTVYDGSATEGEIRYTATNSFGLSTSNPITVEIPAVPLSEYSFELVESGMTYTTDEEVPLVIQLSDFVNARPPILIENATFTNTPDGTGSDALSIDATARTLTFTPIMGFVGNASIPLYAEYPAGTVRGPIAIPVDVVGQNPVAPNIVVTAPPGLLDPATIDFSEHVSDTQTEFDDLVITFGISNIDTPTVYISAGVTGAGPTQTTGTHTLSGNTLSLLSDSQVPAGSYNYEYTVTDSDNNMVSAFITLIVPDYAPGIEVPDQTHIISGSAGAFTGNIIHTLYPNMGIGERDDFTITYKMTDPASDGHIGGSSPAQVTAQREARLDPTPDDVVSAQGVMVLISPEDDTFTYTPGPDFREDTFEIIVTAEKIGTMTSFQVRDVGGFDPNVCTRSGEIFVRLGPATCERHVLPIERHTATATITLINNSTSSSSTDDWKKKPTFGVSWETNSQFVTSGFVFNQNILDVTDNWHTDFTKTSSIIGDLNTVELKAFAPNGYSMVALSLGLEEIGAPLSESDTSIIVYLERNYENDIGFEITGVEHEQSENGLVDESKTDVAISRVACSASDKSELCILFEFDFTVQAPLMGDVVAITAVDEKRRTTTTYINEGVEFIGPALLMPLEHSLYEKTTSQDPATINVLTRDDRVNDVWSDADGYLWTKNSHDTWIQLTRPDFVAPADDPNMSIKTRIHSGFAEMVQLEKDRARLIFDADAIRSTLDEDPSELNFYLGEDHKVVLLEHLSIDEILELEKSLNLVIYDGPN